MLKPFRPEELDEVRRYALPPGMVDDRVLGARMHDDLPKPFRPEELDEVIGRLAMA